MRSRFVLAGFAACLLFTSRGTAADPFALERANQRLQRKAKDLKKDKDRLEKKVERYVKQRDNLKEDVEKLEKKVEELEAKVDELKDKLKEAKKGGGGKDEEKGPSVETFEGAAVKRITPELDSKAWYQLDKNLADRDLLTLVKKLRIAYIKDGKTKADFTFEMPASTKKVVWKEQELYVEKPDED